MTSSISFRERIILYALLTSLTSLSIDALLPGLRQIGEEVGVAAPLSTQHIISLFIFGMAFGELLLGPLSDAMGRKKALVLGLGVYVAGTIIAMLAGFLEMVILGRFLQGVGVSGPKIATRAEVASLFGVLKSSASMFHNLRVQSLSQALASLRNRRVGPSTMGSEE